MIKIIISKLHQQTTYLSCQVSYQLSFAVNEPWPSVSSFPSTRPEHLLNERSLPLIKDHRQLKSRHPFVPATLELLKDFLSRRSVLHVGRKPNGTLNGEAVPPPTYFHLRHQSQTVRIVSSQTILGQA